MDEDNVTNPNNNVNNGETSNESNNEASTHASVCSYSECGKPAVKICPQCGQDFCDEHECRVHTKVLDTQREPIIDEDGTQHRGERIKLIGEDWPHQAKMVEDMTDDEAVEFITVLQKRLEVCNKTGTYLQITIAHAQYVLGARQHSRYVKAMRQREKHEAAKAGILNFKTKKLRTASGQQIPSDIMSLMKAFNLTYEAALLLKNVLGAKKS